MAFSLQVICQFQTLSKFIYKAGFNFDPFQTDMKNEWKWVVTKAAKCAHREDVFEIMPNKRLNYYRPKLQEMIKI